MTRIPIARPLIGDEEKASAVRALDSGWISHGPNCMAFEQQVAGYLGVRHGRAVNSCTNAIVLTLLALGLQPGDEVIVPGFTCVATLNPVELLGGVCVPVDVDLATFAIDPDAVEAAVTERTRGIIVAHLFGLPADIQALSAIADRRGLWLVEDIALGLGASVGGRMVGSFGTAAVLSFHPRKIITTGEGGMVTCNDDRIADDVAALRNYGASTPSWSRHSGSLFRLPTYARIGLNCKLTDIQGGIGVEQMRRLPAILTERAAIAARYRAELADLDWIEMPAAPAGTVGADQSFVLLVRDGAGGRTPRELAEVRERLWRHMERCGVASVQAAQAMFTIDYYAAKYAWPAEAFPRSAVAEYTSVCLPIFPGLTDEEQARVVEAVRTFDPAAVAA